MKSVLKYPGGKSRVRNLIYKEFPKDFDTYMEPFLGSGTVLLGQERTAKEIVLDSDELLINFFTVIQQEGYHFYDYVNNHIESLKRNGKWLWEIWRDSINYKDPSPVTRAVWFYIMNKSSRSGFVRFNKKTGKCNSSYCGDKWIATRGWATRDQFEELQKRLEDVTIICANSLRILECSQSIYSMFVYADPPYKDAKTEYPSGKWEIEHHERLFKILNKANFKWLLSYDDCEWVRNMYCRYEIKHLEVPYSISNTKLGRSKVKEILIKNYTE